MARTWWNMVVLWVNISWFHWQWSVHGKHGHTFPNRNAEFDSKRVNSTAQTRNWPVEFGNILPMTNGQIHQNKSVLRQSSVVGFWSEFGGRHMTQEIVNLFSIITTINHQSPSLIINQDIVTYRITYRITMINHHYSLFTII